MLQIKEITNKKTWNSFLDKKYKGFAPFFQTWNWGEVQKKLNQKVLRLGVFDKKNLVGIVQIVVVTARRGNYLHLRHGPVFLEQKLLWYKKLITYLKKVAQDYSCSFIRLSPLVEENEKTKKITRELGLRNAPIHNMDAEICWVLDITQPEETLLSNMRKSHRYLIKKALSSQVEVIAKTTVDKDFESFLYLYKSLSQKRHFVAHRGLAEELEILGKDNEAVLLLAKFEEKVIAGALIDFTGAMAIYHHGATDDAYRHLSGSYLLQWHAIKEAKKRGKKLYNFWGIAPQESKKHPWYGLTLFKTGFGGEKKIFIHAKDLPLSIWYIKTYAIELATRLKKGY